MSDPIKEFEEMYFKTLYEFYEKDPEAKVRTGDLAEALRVTPASTTEMVQRLATKGYLEYIPYKGSSLTEKGLKHGRRMKRRHHLAGVLLEHLPFQGNNHSTACRLEHAIDDDLEVALAIYLGLVDSSLYRNYNKIIDEEIGERINQTKKGLRRLSDLEIGKTSTIEMLVISKSDKELLEQLGLKIGSKITRLSKQAYQLDDLDVKINDELDSNIIIRG